LNFLIGKHSCKKGCLAAGEEQNRGSCDTCALLFVTKILKLPTTTPSLNSLPFLNPYKKGCVTPQFTQLSISVYTRYRYVKTWKLDAEIHLSGS